MACRCPRAEARGHAMPRAVNSTLVWVDFAGSRPQIPPRAQMEPAPLALRRGEVADAAGGQPCCVWWLTMPPTLHRGRRSGSVRRPRAGGCRSGRPRPAGYCPSARPAPPPSVRIGLARVRLGMPSAVAVERTGRPRHWRTCRLRAWPMRRRARQGGSRRPMGRAGKSHAAARRWASQAHRRRPWPAGARVAPSLRPSVHRARVQSQIPSGFH